MITCERCKTTINANGRTIVLQDCTVICLCEDCYKQLIRFLGEG